MSNLWRQFETLGQKQIAIAEGITLLRMAQHDLERARSSAKAWGAVAVLAQVALIPGNIIVNAFPLPASKSLYRLLVRRAYKEYNRGAHSDDLVDKTLDQLTEEIGREMMRGGLTEFVPGVRILVGLAQDSRAAWKVISTVADGSAEIDSHVRRLNLQITRATTELLRIGVRRGHLFERMQRFETIA